MNALDVGQSETEYSRLIEISARWEAMCELLNGEEVSDFMLSFPEVRQVSDMVGYGGIKTGKKRYSHDSDRR